ncbi:MAG: globin [Saprospiraceae bacterium]
MDTTYSRLGDNNLALLVDYFYDFVIADERINHLFTTDIKDVKEKQYLFLSQFFGGPNRYSDIHGHPKLRMRHIPHKITKTGAMAWLQCMAKAVDKLPIDDALKDEVFNRFPRVASHMINSEEE